MEIGDIKEVANVGKMVYIDLGEDNCFVIAPKLVRFIDGLRQKIDDIEQYVEHKKVCGKSSNFSDEDLKTNEIMNELEEILYWNE